ncbi:type IV secretion system protein VirB3 [Achromobacter spanius]|uniref:type IV secretion system protein VirB3 n=1 Tax=Achromobacter spanius TaxID=217203 RepID=UPI00382A0C7E
MSQEDQDNEITLDDLLVGMTQPPTKWGVPYVAVVFEFIASAVFFLATTKPQHFAVIIPIHLVLMALTATDPLVFGKIQAWATTKARCGLRSHWGAASFSPLRCHRYDAPPLKRLLLHVRVQLGIVGRDFRAREISY